MARVKNSDLVWAPIDTDAFSGSLKTKFAAWKAKVAELNAVRDDLNASLEATMRQNKLIPNGMEPKFGYGFGKLSVAFIPEGTSAGKGGGSSTKIVLIQAAPTSRTAARKSQNAAHPD